MRRKYTKELLEPLVKDSVSVSQVLQKLGLKPTGGNYRNVQSKIRFFEIDTSHFSGQSWAKGKTAETDESVKRFRDKTRRPNEDIFIENSPETKGYTLRKRLFELGWDYKCKICGLSEWLDKEITLHIDHINGINNDNRYENLRFLCPNCHQQTETWGAKNRRY